MDTHLDSQQISRHYGRDNLATVILAALERTAKNPQAITIDDLAPVDQFHTGGKRATFDLAHHAGLTENMRVLDVGGGLGGAARILAQQFGCSVEVLDLTEEYCETGRILTERIGLSDRVSFRHGNALNLPYADASFDLVWTQHSSMNIPDKPKLYAETFRVLRPGGRLALHEIMAGAVAPLHLPVPWARQAALSHLLSPSEARQLIKQTGFREVVWLDETAEAVRWFQERLAAVQSAAAAPPPLGLHLLLGSDFSQMFGNQVRNLQEGRIAVIQAVFERPKADDR